ncbi:hypothetical protein CXG81DRAFT_26541 [Caulochytrium protostelioides]|uniref:Complex III subunit 7 n=1 Tax=Caulochytrium protostelioides TaxID=1555241 RepID=A0A4P9X6E5_9FUNG|nr:hypothetical protein CXG81DRAFT_26541 [Caulochytrium protostelioides]|eukprot:RKP00757.1 hypothetical protein CXG81DRAFT_26541 [Caulochytrium protostelioides]
MSATAAALVRAVRGNPTLARITEFYNQHCGHRQLGLKSDDMLPDEDPIAQEALRRLSPQEVHERHFRFSRVLAIDAWHDTLPEQYWIKPHEDTPYLSSLIEQIKKEKADARNFDQLTVEQIPDYLKIRNRVTQFTV